MAQAKKDDGKRRDSNGKILKNGELQRKNGTYQYVYYQDKKRHDVYAKTLAELREKEKSIQQDLKDGIDIESGKMTLNKCFADRMERRKHKLRESTLANYKSMYAYNVEESELGQMEISAIRPKDIEEFYIHCTTRKEPKPLTYNTVKLLHNLIFQTLGDAVRNRYIRINPAAECMDVLENHTKKKETLTSEQFNSVIEFCRSNNYDIHIPYLIIAVETGCRVGELCGLTWNDINNDTGILQIKRQLQYKNFDGSGCTFRIAIPKTDAGKRSIVLTPRALEAFHDLHLRQMKYGIHCNTEIDGISGFCFLSSNGQPLATNAVNSFLYNIQNAYNKANPENPIPHISSHILRHTSATLLSESNAPLSAIQGRLGHASAQITANVYDHSNEDLEYQRKVIQKIGNVVNG